MAPRADAENVGPNVGRRQLRYPRPDRAARDSGRGDVVATRVRAAVLRSLQEHQDLRLELIVIGRDLERALGDRRRVGTTDHSRFTRRR